MISLARRLAMRQEVEALFADDGEVDEGDIYDAGLRFDSSIAEEVSRAHIVSYRTCVSCEAAVGEYKHFCKPCAIKARRASYAKHDKKRRPLVEGKTCRTCGKPCSKFANRCGECANKHRLEAMRERTKRSYAARRAAGLCVMCKKPLGVESGRWRHEACHERTRGGR